MTLYICTNHSISFEHSLLTSLCFSKQLWHGSVFTESFRPHEYCRRIAQIFPWNSCNKSLFESKLVRSTWLNIGLVLSLFTTIIIHPSWPQTWSITFWLLQLLYVTINLTMGSLCYELHMIYWWKLDENQFYKRKMWKNTKDTAKLGI